jgi:hypothetical protein
MQPIVSLVSGFSVGTVLEGGRVSLAHLIEFSHFVDLYVLEPEILMDECERGVYLRSLETNEECPISFLPEGRLCDLVNIVTENTLHIYDAAPKERMFSIGSYEYWLDMNPSERDNVSEIVPVGAWFSREGLLPCSRKLDIALTQLIDELGKTNYTLMPSSRNLLPFLDAFHQIETPIQILYRKLAEHHRSQVERVLALNRPRTVYLPPLLTILLSRCGSWLDIPKRLPELRYEFTGLRRDIVLWEEELARAETMQEQIQLRDDLDGIVNSITKKYEDKRRGFYKSVSGAFLDSLEDGNLNDVWSKPLVAAAKEVGMLIPDTIRSRKFTGLLDLMDLALNIRDYSGLLHKVFGDKLDVSQYEVRNARKYVAALSQRYNLDLPSPR